MGFTGKFKFRCRAVFMACLLFTAPSVIALGLGEITLNSSLNEPLGAEIVVLSSENLEDGQLLVSLASPEAFERAGISRDFFYSQMQFSIYRNSADLHVIKIVTEQPVVEPYLNFLIQLQWPAGRVMREYTLLLDLPIYTDEQQPVKIAPAVQSPQKLTPQSAAVETSAASVKTLVPYRDPLSGDEHQVIVGDTLWNVAKRLRPTNTTILQTMDSLYRHNATAFVGGDANRIKAGSVLRLPSFDEISVEAGNTVAAQIGLNNPSIASSELEQALEQANETAPADADSFSFQEDQPLVEDGRLELASAFAGDQVEADRLADVDNLATPENGSQSGFAEASQVSQLAEDLAVANDEVNKTQQENIELRERLALLEAQVATMVALLEQSEKLEASAPTQSSLPASAASDRDDQSLAQQLSAVPSYFWLLLIAVILLLLVLLVRKSAKEKESRALSDDLAMAGGYEKYGEASPSSPSNQNELNALDDLELDPDDNLFDESDTDIFDTGEEPQESEVFDMMVEAVAEADVFLSLGKIPEAIDVLEEARAQDPADASSRLKLMEVLFRENRKDELRELFDEIQATGDKAATEMAAIIIGPDSASEAVSSIAEDTVAAELEGLDFQRAEFEDLGLGSVDLADLELDEIDLDGVEFEGSQLEDLDLDNLTADDFDIEPAEEPQAELSAQSEEAVDIELPGTEDLDQGLIADEAPVEVSDETSSEVLANDLMDDFADFDDGNQQTAVDVKLDLAKTYLEMGDPEGAKEILEELIEDSDESSDKEGVAKARALLETV